MQVSLLCVSCYIAFLQERTPSLATLISGTADSVGASIAQRLGNFCMHFAVIVMQVSTKAQFCCVAALKTGWSIVLACNLPKNSPNLEVKYILVLMRWFQYKIVQ